MHTLTHSLTYTHTNSQTHTHSQTLTHSHTHTDTHTLTHTLSYTHTKTHRHTHTHTLSHTCTHTQTYTLRHTYTLSHTHTQTHTLTHTQTHPHTHPSPGTVGRTIWTCLASPLSAGLLFSAKPGGVCVTPRPTPASPCDHFSAICFCICPEGPVGAVHAHLDPWAACSLSEHSVDSRRGWSAFPPLPSASCL